MPSKKHGQLYANLGMPYTKLGRLCSNLGMLHEFAGTPYEGEEGIYKESRGHRALHGVLFIVLTTSRENRGRADLVWTTPRQSRGRAVPFRRERNGKLGMPLMRFVTPNEERTMPAL
jgi:hypothetical protein